MTKTYIVLNQSNDLNQLSDSNKVNSLNPHNNSIFTDETYQVGNIKVPITLDHRVIMISFFVMVFICFLIFFLNYLGLTNEVRLLGSEIDRLRSITTMDVVSVNKQTVVLENLQKAEAHHHIETKYALYALLLLNVIVLVVSVTAK
jgi:hypothetical protein